MSDIEIVRATRPPNRDKMNALLTPYYDGMIRNLVSIGGPEPDASLAVADFWQNVDQFLPPLGCLLIAKKGDTWLGTGALRSLPGRKGELKHLYVRPEARGTGLGRRLVTERIAVARKMGLKTLLVDTLTPTVEMQGLYASLGFEKTGPYPESVTYNGFPELADFILFFRKDLDE